MKQELDNELCEKYPKIFQDRYGDMTTTAMCWGFECGDGWHKIIDSLCSHIQHHIDWCAKQRLLLLESNPHNLPIPNEVAQVVAVQVKEKFGGLRFYYEGGDDKIDGMVQMAEAWASKTCDVCGESGKSRNTGWIRTLCDKHFEELEQKKKNGK